MAPRCDGDGCVPSPVRQHGGGLGWGLLHVPQTYAESTGSSKAAGRPPASALH